jgi:hypothetical protein
LLNRLNQFIPELRQANAELSEQIRKSGNPEQFNIEHIEDAANSRPYIEMDMSFLFDVHLNPKAPTSSLESQLDQYCGTALDRTNL